MVDGERRIAETPGSGLKCGKCKAVLPSVTRTIETPGFINRERKCPSCGELNITDERVIHTRPIRSKRVRIRREDYL